MTRGLSQVPATPATTRDLTAVHHPHYLNFLKVASQKGGSIDFDTTIPPGLYETVRLAAGGAVNAASAVLNSEVRNAFALVRPPGHHAGTACGGGFCYLNNVAVMSRAAQRMGAPKVLILDWDAHHGNGTQEIFDADPTFLFISVHQMPLYPGSGRVEVCGEGKGTGGGGTPSTCRFPLVPQMTATSTSSPGWAHQWPASSPLTSSQYQPARTTISLIP